MLKHGDLQQRHLMVHFPLENHLFGTASKQASLWMATTDEPRKLHDMLATQRRENLH
ncbi:Uncharacterised protein [Vibrio cholerae]|nr:Uncharacterised protein [Vibrio cholerae]CSC12958.1 Uncharacterised protein [Vibrio cholerae]CSC76754.1 Uncharacterised protein [Vibrio cholerae]CSC85708.1 Uncharacterised protein [Vibrio cholerae]CSD54076.1 Uncharacterised protein [Vibrio cholerae]